MDGVSGAASILSIIDLSAKICKYILHVRDAPKERKRLYNGIRDCSEILKIIEASILDFDRAEGSITSHIFVSLHTPLDQLDHTLRYLATKLSCKDDNNPPTKCTEDNSTVDYNPRDLMKDRFGKLFDSFKKSFSNKQIIRKPFIDVSRNLTWPLKESDTDRVLKDIESKKSNLQLAMQHNHQQLLLGVKEISVHNQERLKQSIDTLFNRDKLRDVLEWCKAIEYGEQQERLRSSRTAGTETRLDNEQSFKDWFESSRQTLVCFGHPGVGKTFLTSSVVDKVISLSEQTSTSLLNQTMDIGFAYIYCDIKNEPDQEADKLTASLFKQLIRGCRCLPKAVTDLYEMIGCNNPRQPTGTELLELLPSILALYSRVFIVIDALDTCEVVHRNTFLETILQLQEKHPINIFATTRPFPEQSLKALFADRPWRQETIVARDEDIHLYVNSTVSKLAPCADQNPELLVEIKAKVTEAANGIFLLVPLYIGVLEEALTADDIRSSLQGLSRGSYTKAYEATVERIERQSKNKVKIANQVIMWLTLGKTHFTTDQVRHALSVRCGKGELNTDFHSFSDEFLLSVCAGLAVVHKDSQTIRLLHSTTYEYFENEYFHQKEINAQQEIAGACIAYLSLDEFGSGPCATRLELAMRLREYPFLRYAAKNWGYHTRVSGIQSSPVLDFLKEVPKLRASYQIMHEGEENLKFTDGYILPSGRITAMHLAAQFGLCTVLEDLLVESVQDIEVQDHCSRTPLATAAAFGHKDFIEQLLAISQKLSMKVDIEAGSGDLFENGPLALAAGGGHAGVLRVLLENDANPNRKNYFGKNPLVLSVLSGSKEVVEALLQVRGISFDWKDNKGRTPLSYAAKAGNIDIFTRLLEFKPEDADLSDNMGYTPLAYAVCSGRDSITQVLLERANVSSRWRGRDGRGLLSHAARYGFVKIVQMLLVTDAIDLLTDRDGGTPLWYAICNGHEEAAKHLISSNLYPTKVNSMITGGDGQGHTLLTQAAEKGSLEIVRLLLDRGASVDITTSLRVDRGQTPLSFASEHGYLGVAKLLLAREADPNIAEDGDINAGLTPLVHAARNGHLEIVRCLLDRKANPDIVIMQGVSAGRTPLSFAAERGYLEIVKLLCNEGAKLDTEATGEEDAGRTPLSYASENGHLDVVKFLLSKNGSSRTTKRVRPDSKATAMYIADLTPLSFAAERGYVGVVDCLLSTGEVNVDMRSTIQDAGSCIKTYRTPLTLAAENGHMGVVKRLLKEPHIDIGWSDSSDDRAADLAKRNGHFAIYELLYDKDSESVP